MKLRRREFLTGAVAGGVSAAARSDLVAAVERIEQSDEQQNTMAKDNSDNLEFLKKYSTTMLESAIYLITGTHDNIASTRPGLVRRTPGKERLVGYAVTGTFSTDPDDARGRRENLDYWNYVFSGRNPKIAVSLDAGREPASGSSWGQANAGFHRAFGCLGVLTNGGVRDIDIIEKLDFTVFSGHLTIGHGNPHWINFGEPATLFGATFRHGDAICADEHGAIVIPTHALPHIEEAVTELNRRTGIIAAYLKSPDLNPAGLVETTKKVRPAIAWKPSQKR